jgi:hypothetical protein
MMPGPMLSARLESKQKEFEERYGQIFHVNNKVGSIGTILVSIPHFFLFF